MKFCSLLLLAIVGLAAAEAISFKCLNIKIHSGNQYFTSSLSNDWKVSTKKLIGFSVSTEKPAIHGHRGLKKYILCTCASYDVLPVRYDHTRKTPAEKILRPNFGRKIFLAGV